MSQRIYQSLISVFLSSYVRIGQRNIPVKFTGGQSSPKQVNGKLITSDLALQKALESSPEYGKKWIRIMPPHGAKTEEDILTEKKIVPPDPKKDIEVAPVKEPEGTITKAPNPAERDPQEIDPNDDLAEERQAISLSGISGAQGVRTYIMQNYKGYTFNDLKSTEKILQVAAKLNLRFPDWQYKTV